MTAVVEGIDETSEFYQWMIQQNAKPNVIKKLITVGYDSIEMIESIDTDDIAEIINESDFKGSEKINFKMIIKNLSNKHSFVNPEETKAIIEMEKKLKSIKDSIQLITETEIKIDEQILNHTKLIKNTFKEFHNELNKREKQLIKKLKQIANTKKNKLKNASTKLNQKSIWSKEQINSCHKSLKQSIEMSESEERKKLIIKKAKDIKNIQIITNQNSIINNSKINIKMDKKLIVNSIKSFGKFENITNNITPIIISLNNNNKNNNIQINWKFNQKHNDGQKQKLRIEWTETETKSDEKWEYNKEFELKDLNNNNMVEIKVKNKNGKYFVKMIYFNGSNWSKNSNIKSILIKQKFKFITDKFDKNNCSKDIIINGNIVTNNSQHNRSVYLLNVVQKGIHTWKFKADKITQNYFNLIGIWKTNSGTPKVDNYFTNVKNNGYAYIISQQNKTDPSNPGYPASKYGVLCKGGDVIEMILDFNALCLSYKVNGMDCGKAFDVENTEYKAAIALRGDKEDCISLISYKCE